MKIYIVMHQERHVDLVVTPFVDLEEAIAYAKKTAMACCRAQDNLVEMDIIGWLFHIEYSGEGDALWITEHELKID